MANGPDTLVIMFSPASTCIESCLLRQGQCGLSISWSLEAVSSPLLPPILAFSLPAPSEDRALCAHHLHSCAERPADARAGTRVVPPGPASSAVPLPCPSSPRKHVLVTLVLRGSVMGPLGVSFCPSAFSLFLSFHVSIQLMFIEQLQMSALR